MYKEHFDRMLQENCTIYHNPSVDTLRDMARPQEQTSRDGQAVYTTKIRSRSAKHTYHVDDGVALGLGQKKITREDAKDVYARVLDYLDDQELIRVDRRLGQDEDVSFHCRMYVQKPYARLAYMWAQSLFEPIEANHAMPQFLSVYVPDWEETKIIVDPQEGLTVILGTDYFGEAKKSFLRKAMYKMKQDYGGLGLHAGSKQVWIQKEGKIEKKGFLLFGLSGTGKTTLTVHDYGLEGDEGVVIKQDDVVLMDENGYCYGTERGFFIKTEGLDKSQEVLYNATQHPDSIFENVWLHENGDIDFQDTQLTSNGRGIVLREIVKHTDKHVDMPKAHNLIFITRREDIVPPVVRLSPEQGAAFFMLGESIETSAGDPTKAGQSKREVGTNPFIIGAEEEEGNRLLDILRKNPDMQCYVLNTGRVGKTADEPGKKITIALSTHILRHIAYDDIEWQEDPDWGYEIPVRIPGIDISQFDPCRFYGEDEYRQLTDNLRRERREWLARYPGLATSIQKAI